MLNDVRHAFRSLRRAPGFTIMAALTLALGIGANAAIFSVAWQVLLKPLPFPDEDRLVVIAEAYGPNRTVNTVAPGNYQGWQTENQSFEAVAAFTHFQSEANLTDLGEPAQVRLTQVTADFFNILKIRPLLGRPILPGDDERDEPVVVLSAALWQTLFNRAPTVIGQKVRLDGTAHEIVGVMPDAAGIGTQQADLWTRLALGPAQKGVRQAHYLDVIARLRPGVTLRQADADVVAIAARAATEFPVSNRNTSAIVLGFREQLSGGVRQPVLVLLGAAGLVLLIACANITGLQLARHLARRKNTAIRAALGATRVRLFREFLIEGLLLAMLGAYGGLLLAVWVLATVGQLAPALVSREISARPDAAVALFTLAVSVVSGVIVAAGPGWRAASSQMRSSLTSRGTADTGGAGIRSALVAFEVALAVVVLTGAALLVSSLALVLRVHPGFEFEQGLIVDLSLPQAQYPDVSARARFFDQVIARVEGLTGVTRACVSNAVPLAGRKGMMSYVPEGETRMVNALPSTVSPGCFDVLRVPIHRGRGLADLEPVRAAVVSESTARDMWPGSDPIGKRFHVGLPDGDLVTVVGVAGNIRHRSLESGFSSQVWMSHTTGLFNPRFLLVRTEVPPAALAPAIRQAVRELDPRLPASRVRTMADVRDEVLGPRRFNMAVLAGYGAGALVLCAVGIYGLLAQIVGQRTQEIGVRMALGAAPRQVVRHVVAGTLVSVAAGGAAGVAVALLLSRVLRRMLFGVSPTEPGIYAAVVLTVMVVALVAAYFPARRATRVDPVTALGTS